ncbi:MAG: response regulator transcription factor [Nitrospirae bacterium]|nr:response regulator transcription factor [Nitrospirota bacterium]
MRGEGSEYLLQHPRRKETALTYQYSIILADDHALFRKGLKGIIERAPGLEVTGEAGDGIELLKLLGASAPDMVILDISMPNLRGIETLREMKARHPEVKSLVLTMHKDKEYLRQSISAGADGYMLKEEADPALFAAIDRLRQGKMYVSPQLTDDMVMDWARTRRDDIHPTLNSEALTTREREILKLIAEGKASKDIADLLYISPRTVDRHRSNIILKLRIRNVADLVKYAIQKGYV